MLPPQPERAQEEEGEAPGGGTPGRRAELGTQPQLSAITIWPNQMKPPATSVHGGLVTPGCKGLMGNSIFLNDALYPH